MEIATAVLISAGKFLILLELQKKRSSASRHTQVKKRGTKNKVFSNFRRRASFLPTDMTLTSNVPLYNFWN